MIDLAVHEQRGGGPAAGLGSAPVAAAEDALFQLVRSVQGFLGIEGTVLQAGFDMPRLERPAEAQVALRERNTAEILL